MSVLDKEVLFEPFTPDRTGHLAFRAYVAALTASHITKSDGTLPFDDSIIRWQLLTMQPAVTDEDLKAVRAQLEDLGLVVGYVSEPKRYALVVKWWTYNTRPDRARRAIRTPPVPDEVLQRFPLFAAIYRRVPTAGEKSPKQAPRSGKGREMPGKTGKGRAPDPDPEPDSASGPRLVPQSPVSGDLGHGPSPCATPNVAQPTMGGRAMGGKRSPTIAGLPGMTGDALVERFLSAYLERWGVSYQVERAEWGKVTDLVSQIPGSRNSDLLTMLGVYVNENHDATLGGFCETFASDPSLTSGRAVGPPSTVARTESRMGRP